MAASSSRPVPVSPAVIARIEALRATSRTSRLPRRTSPRRARRLRRPPGAAPPRCGARRRAGRLRPAATYCSRENSSVTLTGAPAKIAASIAGRLGARNLMKRLGLPPRRWRSRAAASVLSLSWASSGEISSDTQPSTPSVRAKTGRNSSAARVRSASASSKNRSSPTRRRRHPGDVPVLGRAVLIALSKIVGLDVSLVTESSSM